MSDDISLDGLKGETLLGDSTVGKSNGIVAFNINVLATRDPAFCSTLRCAFAYAKSLEKARPIAPETVKMFMPGIMDFINDN